MAVRRAPLDAEGGQIKNVPFIAKEYTERAAAAATGSSSGGEE